MTVTRSPSSGSVYWTAFTELEGTAEPTDPLRFDMYAQRLGNVLLPGITNRVERLRYFGMVCAGLSLTRPARPGQLDRQSVQLWRTAFLDFEAGWAFANTLAADGKIKDEPPLVERAKLKRDFQGLRGANHALAYFRRTMDQPRVRPHQYKLLQAQEAQGGLGSYLIALRTYGFVHADRFELTSLGLELAQAFLASAKRPRRLLSEGLESRAGLATLGDALVLPAPTSAEARLIEASLFAGDHELATVVRRVPPPLRHPGDAEAALRSFARADGDPLARAARYALDFDPMRRSALRLFAMLGRRLAGRAGPARIAEISTDELAEAAEQLRSRASVLSGRTPPQGLHEIDAFSRRLADGSTLAHTVRALLAFHRQEGRRWIQSVGGERVALGAPGKFDMPSDAFHGYTLPSAFRVLEDVEAAR